MTSRIGGGSPSLQTDNRLERMREEQLRQLQEMRLVNNRGDAERLLERLTRQLQNRNAGVGPDAGPAVAQRPGRVDPQPETRRPDERANRGQQSPAQNAPNTSPQAPVSPTLRSESTRGQPPPPTTTQPQQQQSPTPQSPAQAQAPSQANAGSGAPRERPVNFADFPRLVADFQRQNGLTPTGRLDQQTVDTMKDRGVMPPPGSTTSSQQQATPRPVASKEDVAGARQQNRAAEQQQRQRVSDAPSTKPGSDVNQADRVVDPARLLASLVNAGFAAQKGNVTEGLKAFQAQNSLPITGKLDAQTQAELQKQGVLPPEAKDEKPSSSPVTSDKPVEAKQQIKRALSETAPTTKNAADRDVQRDPIRPQAPTDKPTTSADVSARAPVTSPEAQAAEKQRLDTVLAQQAATERGVQEAKGDPKATKGHGEIAGEGVGEKGKGAQAGGGNIAGQGPSGATANVDGPEGDESAVGNAKAGDDDFSDEERGEGNMDDPDAQQQQQQPQDGEDVEHWEVPPLSEQIAMALEMIVRDDVGAGAVTYTWDVTFYRPGIYAAGQPAEEIWHVAVNKATAFDPVWQKAADAIASRMLYAEPEAQPPTLDDFIMALRRARVREPDAGGDGGDGG